MLAPHILTRILAFLGLFCVTPLAITEAIFIPRAALAEPATENCQPAEAEGWIAERAVSLKQLQRDHAQCGEDCPTELRELRGLGRVDGFVIDRENADIVLFGPAWQPGDPIQYTDDMVVALRAAALRYSEVQGNTRYVTAPGVTLEPRPGTIAVLQRAAAGNGSDKAGWVDRFCEACRAPMDLAVLGMPFDTTASAKMAFADYVLKSVTNSDLPVHMEGFQSLTAMQRESALEALRTGRVRSASQMTRLWFYPGLVTYKEQQDGVAVNRADVVIRQQAQVVMADGRHHDGGREEPEVARWTCQASRMYREIAAAAPETGWDQLARLMRVFAVARLIVDRDAARESGLDLSYLLDRHVLAHVVVKHEWEGVAHIERVGLRIDTGRMVRTLTVAMSSCGGVTLAFDQNNLRPEAVAAERVGPALRRVIGNRPTPTAAVWLVQN
jgi:hypothetical protein